MICTNIRRCHQYPANERVEVKKGGGKGRQERRRRGEGETGEKKEKREGNRTIR